MNGNWYPWAASVNGNTPASLIAAWRHVHDLFSAAGARNVEWVWCPNAGGPTPIADVYPGDAYVDIVGMDGYNWGNGTTGYQAPASVFSSLLSQVQLVAHAKPVLINETGTSAAAGNEETWMEQLFAYVKAQPIFGVVYSDFGNWVIDDQPQAMAGAAAGLADF
jgi:beta-mannanase